jgi:hypothetical protein
VEVVQIILEDLYVHCVFPCQMAASTDKKCKSEGKNRFTNTNLPFEEGFFVDSKYFPNLLMVPV